MLHIFYNFSIISHKNQIHSRHFFFFFFVWNFSLFDLKYTERPIGICVVCPWKHSINATIIQEKLEASSATSIQNANICKACTLVYVCTSIYIYVLRCKYSCSNEKKSVKAVKPLEFCAPFELITSLPSSRRNNNNNLLNKHKHLPYLPLILLTAYTHVSM